MGLELYTNIYLLFLCFSYLYGFVLLVLLFVSWPKARYAHVTFEIVDARSSCALPIAWELEARPKIQKVGLGFLLSLVRQHPGGSTTRLGGS
jgi:hypothetical protein